jgi:hypothetical protein
MSTAVEAGKWPVHPVADLVKELLGEIQRRNGPAPLRAAEGKSRSSIGCASTRHPANAIGWSESAIASRLPNAYPEK